MKKVKSVPVLILVVFVFMVIFFPAFSLEADVGFKTGLNFSKLNTSGSNSPASLKYLMKLNVGIFYDFRFNESFSILGEIFYTTKGFKQTQSIGQDENIIKLKLDYIEVPVSVKYIISTGGSIRPYIFGGGYVGYRIRAKNFAYTQGSKTEIVTDMNDLFKRSDFGFIGGAGAEYLWNDSVNFILEARYSFGLPDIYKGSSDLKFKNRTLSIMIGIGF